ncbi:TetR family transcriptional regulator [Propionibacterium freudenreichii]|nr:TetR family transcriptional regulator [Propionibacterium freudenreichii]
MTNDPQRLRAARRLQIEGGRADSPARVPLTVERITDAALKVVSADGYDALTIRSVAQTLGCGPSSLYAHIVNRLDIDELIIGRLCAQIALPEPDADRWQAQIRDVCEQLRDLYLAYPGVSRAALAMVPTNLEVLRVAEGMLAILLAGGIEPGTAAWAIDALSLYTAAYALEKALVTQRQRTDGDAWIIGQDELVQTLTAAPAEVFPNTHAYATELTSGTGHQRFDFTLDIFLHGLTSEQPR